MLMTMDGNQSLKLVDDIFRSDPSQDDSRDARSELWLSPDKVDKYKHWKKESVSIDPDLAALPFSANVSHCADSRVCS